MKKFLMVTTIQDTVEVFLVPHIKMLEEKGYEVWIGTNIYKNLPKDLENNKWINISFSRNPFSLNSFKAIGEIRKLIRENDFEMVHFHTPVAAFLGRYGAMLEKQKNIIYTAHGFHFYKGASLVNWLVYYPMELLAARWTDKIITINEEDYQNSLKFKLRKNGKYYKVNGVGINLENYKTENILRTELTKSFEKYNDDFKILTLAELNKNKNQIQILKALKDLIKENNNIKYFMAGKGENRKNLEKYIEENNLTKNIFFLGQVDKKLIPELINNVDLVISTSIREGLGLNLIEAISSGKNILGTDNRGHREIIENKEFLVEINNYNELKKKIKKIMDKELNLDFEETKFSLKVILEKMKEIYGE